MLTLTYFPPGPGATPIAFTKGVPYMLLDATGLSRNEGTPQSRAGVGQWSEMLVGMIVAPHLIGLSIATLATGATAPSFRSP